MKNSEIRSHLIDARDEYIELIQAELMGPGSEFDVPDKEHELISSSPLSRYSVGILFPQGNKVEQDNDETVIIGEDQPEEHSEAQDTANVQKEITEKKPTSFAEFDETANENLDEEIGMATQYKPSSMGLTFLANGKCDTIHCRVSFATYRNSLVSDCQLPYSPDYPDRYSVPSELSSIMSYDNKTKTFRLLRKTTPKEIRDIFERDTIPETEFVLLRNAVYRLNDFLATGYVRVPHTLDDITIS